MLINKIIQNFVCEHISYIYWFDINCCTNSYEKIHMFMLWLKSRKCKCNGSSQQYTFCYFKHTLKGKKSLDSSSYIFSSFSFPSFDYKLKWDIYCKKFLPFLFEKDYAVSVTQEIRHFDTVEVIGKMLSSGRKYLCHVAHILSLLLGLVHICI